jgi:hypothetical protein
MLKKAGCLVLLSLAMPAAQGATSCVVFPAGEAPVQVVQADQVLPAPARLSPCAGFTVRGGAALVCHATADGGRDCTRLAAGAALSTGALADDDVDGGAFAGLLALLRGDPVVRLGVSRGEGEGELQPAGQVLAAASLAQWPLPDIDASFPWHLQLADAAGAPVFKRRLDGMHDRRISERALRRLQPGETYRWQLSAGKPMPVQQPLAGSFRIADGVERASVEAALADVDADPALPARARVLLKAELLAAQGYLLDARLLLRDAGLTASVVPDQSQLPISTNGAR